MLFDSWYASLRNLKSIRDYGWHWLTRLKSNRLVNPDGKGNIPISQAEIPPEGRVVHLKGYGFIKVFRTVSQNGDEEYWASDDLQMDEEEERGELESQDWGIEVYHRVIKQCCGIERALSAEGSGAEESLSLCPAGISAFGGAQVANGSLV
jgi:hypothetical protein